MRTGAGTGTQVVAPETVSADRRAPQLPTRYVFVGERRSARAVRSGASWANGRAAGRTLRESLRAAGLDPRAQVYLNAYRDPDPVDDRAALVPDEQALAMAAALAASGLVVVGLGRRACRALAGAGIACRAMVHPAARGAIRARATYHAHVAAVLARRG